MSEKLKNTFMFFQDIKRDKLYPLLFALDFSLLRECGEPLTDITWEAWPSGPIPSAKDLKRIMGLAKDVFSDSCFTGREIHRMNEFSKLSKKELFKIFENPWKKTLKGGPFQKITVETMLDGLSQEEKDYILGIMTDTKFFKGK